jgi:hypothetical protein
LSLKIYKNLEKMDGYISKADWDGREGKFQLMIPA